MKVTNDEDLDHRAQDYESKIAFLDPASCGSNVGYSVGREYANFDCKVVLSDCSRKIEWSFSASEEYHYDMGLRKIDRAIEMLLAFRAAYVKGWKSHKKWRVGYDARELARKAKKDKAK